MKVYVDTNIVVASIVDTHIHYQQCKPLMDDIGRGKYQGFISGHGLTEIYSVMTRTPFVPRFRPIDVWQILVDDILPALQFVALSNSDYRNIVQDCASMGFVSGRVHDLAHLRAAEKAGCQRIYTFDVRGFQVLAPNLSSRIVMPQ
ncbi:MAG TPA: PIN domain-containing protein [Terriglobales bacterium]|nr:PIN domain-containing protein [Terriglobales bacterium]